MNKTQSSRRDLFLAILFSASILLAAAMSGMGVLLLIGGTIFFDNPNTRYSDFLAVVVPIILVPPAIVFAGRFAAIRQLRFDHAIPARLLAVLTFLALLGFAIWLRSTPVFNGKAG